MGCSSMAIFFFAATASTAGCVFDRADSSTARELRACQQNAAELTAELGRTRIALHQLEQKEAELGALTEALSKVRAERDDLRQIVLVRGGLRPNR